jgi:hypothetical protein
VEHQAQAHLVKEILVEMVQFSDHMQVPVVVALAVLAEIQIPVAIVAAVQVAQEPHLI